MEQDEYIVTVKKVTGENSQGYDTTQEVFEQRVTGLNMQALVAVVNGLVVPPPAAGHVVPGGRAGE